MLDQNQIAELQKVFYALYNRLKDAYWAASTIEAKDQIQGARDLVNAILDTLDRADLLSDNAAMANFTQSLKATVSDLGDLQKQLDHIVHNVTVATQAIDAISEAFSVAGEIVPLVAGAGF